MHQIGIHKLPIQMKEVLLKDVDSVLLMKLELKDLLNGNTLAGSKSSSGYSQTGTAKHNDKYAKVSEEHKIF